MHLHWSLKPAEMLTHISLYAGWIERMTNCRRAPLWSIYFLSWGLKRSRGKERERFTTYHALEDRNVSRNLTICASIDKMGSVHTTKRVGFCQVYLVNDVHLIKWVTDEKPILLNKKREKKSENHRADNMTARSISEIVWITGGIHRKLKTVKTKSGQLALVRPAC